MEKKLLKCRSSGKNFINGATKKRHKSRLAEELFEQMVSSEYCFNQSFNRLWLCDLSNSIFKANYPVEYMAALLTANSGDTDKCRNIFLPV